MTRITDTNIHVLRQCMKDLKRPVVLANAGRHLASQPAFSRAYIARNFHNISNGRRLSSSLLERLYELLELENTLETSRKLPSPQYNAKEHVIVCAMIISTWEDIQTKSKS